MSTSWFSRRLQTALRILFPSKSERAYIRAVKDSNRFDRLFYRSSTQQLHWLFRLFPERHFVLFGEGLGVWPNERFSPHAYMQANPQISDPPFLHYLKSGHETCGDAQPIPQADIGAAPVRQHAQAVVLHVYYPDLWGEFASVLKTLTIRFDLYITLTDFGDSTDRLFAQIEQDFPEAHILRVANRGRDILPFITLVNAGWLEGYEAVCKLHTKKSPYWKDGENWRQQLVSGVLAGSSLDQLLKKFIADPQAGIWVADKQTYSGQKWWGANYQKTASLLARLGLEADRRNLSFPAGSIYWLKPNLIQKLRELHLDASDFEPETGQTDGTLAHAVERAIGWLAEADGQVVKETSQL